VKTDALTFLGYELIVYLVAPVIILLVISVHKERCGERPLKGILWFGVAMMALCATVILFTTLHRATVLGKINRIETAPSQIR
jgi:hypothetical protein